MKEDGLHHFFFDRTHAELVRLQHALHCRIFGDARTNAALRSSLLHYVTRRGLTVTQCQELLRSTIPPRQ